MNFFTDNLTGRSRRLIDYAFGGTESVKGKCDFLLRMNLPPLMGRRDAALDVAEKWAFQQKIAAMSDPGRAVFYCHLSAALRSAANDSVRILAMLTSPDTRRRESHMMLHAILLDSCGAAMANTFELRGVIFSDLDRLQDPLSGKSARNPAGHLSDNLNEIELHLLSQLRADFLQSREKLLLYRSYAEKSFSKENLARYHRAHESTVASFDAKLATGLDHCFNRTTTLNQGF